MDKRFYLFLAMIVVAIVAVGSVSAAEDATIDIADEPADDIVIEDVEADNVDESASDVETDDITADDVDEESRTVPAINYYQYNITTSSNFANINANIANGTYTGYEFVFASGTYNNFAMVTGNNNKFTGNGATIIGSTDNLFTVAGSSNIIITGFNMQVATGKAAVYGANVFNADITNNNITGGKDGINIMQTYDDITISGNTITGFTRDGISLVDHRTFADLSSKSNSVISNNVITGISSDDTEVGMFIGGNFKGTISGNVITNVDTGVDFSGKKAITNGRLYVNFDNNNISDVYTGIYMNNHNVDFFNMTYCNILLDLDLFAIFATDNFNATGYIGVYHSNFIGNTTSNFVTAVGSHKWNNTGFP